MSIDISIICFDCLEECSVGKLCCEIEPEPHDWRFDGFMIGHYDLLRMVETFLIYHMGHEIRVLNDTMLGEHDLYPAEYRRKWNETTIAEVVINDDKLTGEVLSPAEARRLRAKLGIDEPERQ